MRHSFLSICVISLLCISIPVWAKPVPFVDDSTSTLNHNQWTWHSGAGELKSTDSGHLVISVNSPGEGADNKVGAVLNKPIGNIDSFVLDILVDPVSNLDGQGNNQLDFAISIGLPDAAANPSPYGTMDSQLTLGIRDLAHGGDFSLSYKNKNIALPVNPDGAHGWPHCYERKAGPYAFRLIVTPNDDGGSLLRIYHGQFIDVAWEGNVEQRITPKYIGIFSRLNKQTDKPLETTIHSLSIRPIEPELARWQPTPQESVLYALNLDYPGLEEVKAAMDEGDIKNATKLFANYLRTRTNVTGPLVGPEDLNEKQQRIADLMVEDKIFVHAGGPERLHDFRENPDWAADPYDTGGQFAIYNARMWPWLEMGKAYLNTSDEKYPQAFVRQMNSWLDQIPLRISSKPGEPPFFIDGVTLEPPLRFTGNLGRRIELTWWQTYEYFKQSPSFDDASMLRMMDYFARNARLVTNPTVFLAWDDSGLHMATGLLQCATMMPEWKESKRWYDIAVDRLEATFNTQVHPDGTHASLSTGYGWATIDSYKNVFAILERNELPIPDKFKKAIRGMIMGYMTLLRPDFGNISLNDGGWGRIDDKVREHQHLFPDDPEIEFFATNGAQGEAPEWNSRYLPNAGWYVMRTGFGPREKYLFFDGGPVGASHGKHDGLQLNLAVGNSLLLTNSGRGDYTAKRASQWSGQTFAFNTLTPDWHGQNRFTRYNHEKWLGFNPPERPWISNDEFDYAESVYDGGWYGASGRIGGTQTRHVVFLKGSNPPETGYWVVVDTVNPDRKESITWRHPWHMFTEDFNIDKKTKAIETQHPHINMIIHPVDPDNTITVEAIKGQEEPVLMGWRVHGGESRPYSTPVYSWKSKGPATKAWVINTKSSDQEEWGVSDVKLRRTLSTDKSLSFEIKRADGGTDYFNIRDRETTTPQNFQGAQMNGYFQIVRKSKFGTIETKLDVTPSNKTAKNAQ